jgi:glutamate-1-semialdehyde 2,1-aminomutase
MKVAGFTSTGSKRPEALFGGSGDEVPLRMVKSSGCWVLDAEGREYLDFVMALGAVALGYADPEVSRAVREAVERGTIGSLSPVEEEQLASQLGNAIPMLEEVRFLKSGAEAVAGAVRVARTHTGRDRVLGCGYHGWLDWCSRDAGVPQAVQALFDTIPFNDAEMGVARIREQGDTLACVVLEPVVDAAPAAEWLRAIREATERVGAVLIFDEIKTGFRVAHGGATERWGGSPDLIVLGKAMANGYPLAAFGGRAELMCRVHDTWISSTMATEFVSLAAARVTIRRARELDLPARLAERGGELLMGLEGLADKFPHRITGARGIPEMCYLQFVDDETSQHVAKGCARRGLLFKRSAYNFVSLAHDAGSVDTALGILDETLLELD